MEGNISESSETNTNNTNIYSPCANTIETYVILKKRKHWQMVNQDMSAASQTYFLREIVTEGHGIKGIAVDAFRSNHVISGNVACHHETQFHLMMLSLLKDMTSIQQSTLLELFRIVVAYPNLWKATHLPINICDGNKFYLKGIHSMYKNIPHPQIFSYDRHACVKLEDVIRHLVAHGLQFDNVTLDLKHSQTTVNPSKLSKSRVVMDICERVYNNNESEEIPLLLLITLWSDDFEVTHIKTTTSVWILTVTVCPPNGYGTSPLYTHALAIGRKGMNHDSVFSLYCDEMNNLKNPKLMVSGKTKTVIPVVVELLVIAADRPERCSLNSILSHTTFLLCYLLT